MTKNKKGQLSVANIVNWFVLVIIAGILSLIMQPFINNAANTALQSNQTLQAYIIYSIIPFMWISIIMVLLYYAQPQSYLRQY